MDKANEEKEVKENGNTKGSFGGNEKLEEKTKDQIEMDKVEVGVELMLPARKSGV